MKKGTIPAIISLSLAFSMPAVAGPNWDVIHRAEANKAERKGEQRLVLPLDHGPRAITTPWLNSERLGDLASQVQTDDKVAKARAKKKTYPRKRKAVVAAHTPHSLPPQS